MYKPLKDAGELKFNSCTGCEKNCCTPNGGFHLAPLILEDYAEVHERFPILFANVGQVFKSVIILNNAKQNCIYFDDKTKLCTIYENRPPACVMYPISPLFDEICVDTSCHGVSTKDGDFLCNKQGFNENFHHKRVDEFYPKLRHTQKFLNQVRFSLKKVINIVGIDLFKIDEKAEIDKEFKVYLDMHYESLKFVKNYE